MAQSEVLPNLPHAPHASTKRGGGRDFANTLAKGLDLLRCFTSGHPVLSNAELARLTGMSRPTVSRFTFTLCTLGYLRLVPASGHYELGAAILSLGHAVLANIGLRQVARPHMHQLADALGGAVSMGVPSGTDIVYVETCRARQATSGELSDIGMTHPMIGSAIGRAFLAGHDEEQRQALLNIIRVKTPWHWKTFEKSSSESIEQYRSLGFCVSFGEIDPMRYAVGVPLMQQINGDPYVFNCTLYSYQTTRAAMLAEIGPRLRQMVEQIERHVQSLGRGR